MNTNESRICITPSLAALEHAQMNEVITSSPFIVSRVTLPEPDDSDPGASPQVLSGYAVRDLAPSQEAR